LIYTLKRYKIVGKYSGRKIVMKYPRPPYMSPGIEVTEGKALFSPVKVKYPLPDFPISRLENFRRAAEHNDPLWVPNALTDFQTLYAREMGIGETIGFDLTRDLTKSYDYKDWFKTEWTWVPSAGGAMLKPGTRLLDDITDWERGVKFPDLKSWDWKTKAEEFMQNEYRADKLMHVNVGQGCTERLVAVLGGYTEGMTALALEPEAVLDFFNAMADFMIEFIDLAFSLYPVNMLTYHDDWGTERDTFFSEKMMEELVYGPTKRIVDHVKSKGAYFELHSCGKIERFVPYMIDLDIDFIQIQRRANDIPAIKEKYGDKIGINCPIEDKSGGTKIPTMERYLENIRESVDLYASGGGYYTTAALGNDPENIWDSVFELYAYSREYYDTERGK
jgi:hypothetical protein